MLKECFAKLSESGEVEPINNLGIDSYIHGLIYLAGEIIDIDTDRQNQEEIKRELRPLPAIIQSIRKDLIGAIGNVLDGNTLLQDNLSGTNMILGAISGILDMGKRDEDLAKIMINSKLNLVKKTLDKLLTSIKISQYDNSKHWPEKILRFMGLGAEN